jgi:hypothetical protein
MESEDRFGINLTHQKSNAHKFNLQQVLFDESCVCCGSPFLEIKIFVYIFISYLVINLFVFVFLKLNLLEFKFKFKFTHSAIRDFILFLFNINKMSFKEDEHPMIEPVKGVKHGGTRYNSEK